MPGHFLTRMLLACNCKWFCSQKNVLLLFHWMRESSTLLDQSNVFRIRYFWWKYTTYLFFFLISKNIFSFFSLLFFFFYSHKMILQPQMKYDKNTTTHRGRSEIPLTCTKQNINEQKCTKQKPNLKQNQISLSLSTCVCVCTQQQRNKKKTSWFGNIN